MAKHETKKPFLVSRHEGVQCPILASLKVVLVDVSQREARKEKEGPEVVAGET